MPAAPCVDEDQQGRGDDDHAQAVGNRPFEPAGKPGFTDHAKSQQCERGGYGRGEDSGQCHEAGEIPDMLHARRRADQPAGQHDGQRDLETVAGSKGCCGANTVSGSEVGREIARPERGEQCRLAPHPDTQEERDCHRVGYPYHRDPPVAARQFDRAPRKQAEQGTCGKQACGPADRPRSRTGCIFGYSLQHRQPPDDGL